MIVRTGPVPSLSCLEVKFISWVTQSMHWSSVCTLKITLPLRSTTGCLLLTHLESLCISVAGVWVIAITLFIQVSSLPQHWGLVHSFLSMLYLALRLMGENTTPKTYLRPSLCTYWACRPKFPSTLGLLSSPLCSVRPLVLADIPIFKPICYPHYRKHGSLRMCVPHDSGGRPESFHTSQLAEDGHRHLAVPHGSVIPQEDDLVH